MGNHCGTARTDGLGLRDKAGYAMGDLASCLVFGLEQSVLQKYYTDVLQLRIVNIMLLFVIARLWDAVNDPIWGRIVDRAGRSGEDRYRCWLRRMAVPTALAAILMFVRLPGLSQTQYTIYACVTYVLFGMMYTTINIPYGSLVQVITSDERERASLSVFRSVGSTFGAIPAMLLISFCYQKLPDGSTAMSYRRILVGACIIAAFSVFFYLWSYRWTKERVRTEPALRRKGQTRRLIRIALRSRPFMTVCAVGMLFLTAQMFGQSYYPYLFNYYFARPALSMLPTVCQHAPVAVILPFVGRLGNRFGRRELCAYGMLLSGLCYLALFFLQTADVWVYLGGCLVIGLGNSFVFLLIWSLAADAIEYNEISYGIYDRATSYAFFTFVRKLGQTGAAILINLSLLRIGYTDNVLNTSRITAATLRKMYNTSVLIPAVLLIGIYFCLRFVYPHKKPDSE